MISPLKTRGRALGICPKQTRPAHWALAAASPEDSGAAAPRPRRPPGPPPSAAAPKRAEVEKTWPRPCHSPATLPGDVEGQRGPQNRVAPELPERPAAEGCHLEVTQAAAPAAAGPSRLATPSFRPRRDGAGQALRVT